MCQNESLSGGPAAGRAVYTARRRGREGMEGLGLQGRLSL
jgi:hypothetical protein